MITRDMLDRMEERDRAELERRAVGWVTISTDLANGGIYVVGIYSDKFDAEVAAIHQQRQMDQMTEPPAPGWHVKAYPIAPKEDS